MIHLKRLCVDLLMVFEANYSVEINYFFLLHEREVHSNVIILSHPTTRSKAFLSNFVGEERVGQTHKYLMGIGVTLHTHTCARTQYTQLRRLRTTQRPRG